MVTPTPYLVMLKRIALLALVLGLSGYAALIGYLKANETALLFPRVASLTGLPAPSADLALPFKSVSFSTADSVRLHAWIIPAGGPDSSGTWILLCHGQSGNIATTVRPRYYAHLRDLGVNILAFDWRGFGLSGSEPSEEGLYRDATAAYNYLRAALRVPPDDIVIYGHSLGTAPAIELATRVRASGLVTEGAPASVRRRAQEVYPYIPVRWVADSEFNSIGRIAQVVMPKLILHATADSTIPINHGRDLFAAAKEPKRFVSLRGGHADAFEVDSALYFGAYRNFLRQIRSARR